MVLNRQRQVVVSLPRLKVFLERVCAELNLDRNSVTVCLVGDGAMARMNRSFRGKMGATDVLSFPSSRLRAAGKNRQNAKSGSQRDRKKSTPAALPPRGFLGDIAISPETARRNARSYRRSLSTELRILILHGVLHLLGYDHETDDGAMTRVENRLRRRLEIG